MSLRKVIIAAAVLCPVALFSQNPEHALVLESNPQFNASAAALSDFGKVSISQTELSFRKDDGGFIGIDGSADSWLASAGAESYSRISDRIVFYGRLSYSYFKGSGMAGSVLRDMYYNPVTFLEVTPGTEGVKTREQYELDGAISYSLSDRWSLGLRMDYESGNNVKTKDPRYRSEWMFMDYDLSVWFRPGDRFAVGASAIYRNTQELVKSHIFGTTDKTYNLGIDRGAFFGTTEAVEGTYGIVSPSDFQPMTNNFYGGSLQVRYGAYHGVLKGLYRSGRYGFGTSNMPEYFTYSGPEFSYEGRFLLGGERSLHDIHFGAGAKFISNTENSFKYTTSAGANTVVTYTGSKQVLDRKDFSANLGYKGSTGIESGRPSMQFGFDAEMQMRTLRATIYPYYRDHDKTSVEAKAFVDKYFYLSKGMIAFGASVRGGAGFGNAAKDGTLATSTGSNLKSFDDLLNRQFEFETAPFAGAGLMITYSRPIKKSIEAYCTLSDDFSSLMKAPEFVAGRSRNVALISLGLTF
ncbi:MAG: hypothetical protein MJY86_04445 [Bacteroidales bacterium]|nr:hypothetical protein [Bacteroidales bacterium]